MKLGPVASARAISRRLRSPPDRLWPRLLRTRPRLNKLAGESIRYDIVKGQVDASAGETPGRVRMEISPDKIKSK